jgi:S-adenosylmethionine uptake transporter
MHLREDIDRQDLKAIIIILICYLFYSGSDATMKYLVQQNYDIIVILSLNSFFVLLFVGIYGLCRNGRAYFKTDKTKYHLFRGCLGCVFAFFITYALGNTSLSEFYMMIFTAPLWVVVFSVVMMKEKINPIRSAIVLLGFAVIAYVFMPDGKMNMDLGLFCALAAGLGVGFNMIYIRKYLRSERPVVISGFNSLVVFVLILPFAVPKIDATVIAGLPFFAMTGALMLSGSVFLSRAFQFASHSVILAPFHYSQMAYGVLIGYIVFAELPSMRVIGGSIALVALGCGLFWYDYNNNRKLRRYVRYDTKS